MNGKATRDQTRDLAGQGRLAHYRPHRRRRADAGAACTSDRSDACFTEAAASPLWLLIAADVSFSSSDGLPGASIRSVRSRATVLIDRLTETGALIAREIGRRLDRWEAMAARADNLRGLPSGGTLLVFGTDDVIAVRGESLAYYPALPKSEGRADGRLVRAQIAERAGDLDAAITGYRDAATSTARTPRALATAGLGRTLRAKGNTREALAAYDELAQMDEARIEGDPAPLVAHRERQAIFWRWGTVHLRSASAPGSSRLCGRGCASSIARHSSSLRRRSVRSVFAALAGAGGRGHGRAVAALASDAVRSSARRPA